MISPWSDHLPEGVDPVLVNAAVEAARAAPQKTPPRLRTAWLCRLIGVALAMLAAGKLATCLADLFPQLARFRGLDCLRDFLSHHHLPTILAIGAKLAMLPAVRSGLVADDLVQRAVELGPDQ